MHAAYQLSSIWIIHDDDDHFESYIAYYEYWICVATFDMYHDSYAACIRFYSVHEVEQLETHMQYIYLLSL